MDKYQEAVEYFIRAPRKEIRAAWEDPFGHLHGCLFYFLTPNGRFQKRPDGLPCGCPTQIKLAGTLVSNSHDSKFNYEVAWTDNLTKHVRAHSGVYKLFNSLVFIERSHLEAIADCQRWADTELNREIPQPPV